MMTAFGRFLELSVPAPDLLRSLAFYRALGFTELPTNDVRRWHYAVVTDGALAIGLHGAGFDEATLAFVRPNLARQVSALEQAGHEFELRRLGAEEFNEAALRTPDGHLILMMEARTWSPGDTGGGSLLGRCAEVILECAGIAATRDFLTAAGFLPPNEEPASLRLQVPGLTLGLQERGRAPGVALRYEPPDREALREALAALGIPTIRSGGEELLKAPEGTRLLLA